MKQPLVRLSLAALALVAGACNQGAPPTGDGSGDGSGDYYPLVDGASWSYQHRRSNGTLWTEEVEMEGTDYDGAPAFLLRDNEDAQGEVTESYLARDATAVSRIHKDVSVADTTITRVDYDPGFLRYDEDWEAGDSVDWTYTRTEYDGSGTLVNVADRLQRFTVESTSESVTVPAGTFTDCAKVSRFRPDNGDRDRYWFARGVGKIKHVNLVSGATEELLTHDVP